MNCKMTAEVVENKDEGGQFLKVRFSLEELRVSFSFTTPVEGEPVPMLIDKVETVMTTVERYWRNKGNDRLMEQDS